MRDGAAAGGRRILVTAFVVLGFVCCANAGAQSVYPNRVVRVVVPYPAGANTDVVTRLYASALSERFGQQFIVDNRPGAGTNLAAELVAHSAPDGYTLFVVQLASHGINSSLFTKLNFDPLKDFDSVGFMARTPMFLVVNPTLPVNSVADLIALAKSQPGKLSFASAGNGSPQHLAGVLFQQRTGIEALHVPYKGAAQALSELMAGQVQFMFDSTAITYARQGKLKVLAIADSQRWPTELQVPAITEAGVKDVQVSGYFGLSAPARTPDAVLQKLNDAVVAIAKREDIRKRLADMGLIPMLGTRAELTTFIAHEIEKWRPIVKAAGATVD